MTGETPWWDPIDSMKTRIELNDGLVETTLKHRRETLHLARDACRGLLQSDEAEQSCGRGR